MLGISKPKVEGQWEMSQIFCSFECTCIQLLVLCILQVLSPQIHHVKVPMCLCKPCQKQKTGMMKLKKILHKMAHVSINWVRALEHLLLYFQLMKLGGLCWSQQMVGQSGGWAAGEMLYLKLLPNGSKVMPQIEILYINSSRFPVTNCRERGYIPLNQISLQFI